MPPKVGMIIVSYNSRLYIDDLFFSLAKVQYPDWSIIFIDNASTDGSAEYLKEKFSLQFPNLTIMKVDKNSGFAAGNNIGLKYLADNHFDYAYLLNQDTAVSPDFLEKALQKMGGGTASVQSLILLHNKGGRANSLGNAIHFLGFGYCYGYGWEKDRVEKYLAEWHERDPELNIAYGSGAGLLLDMRALKNTGFFDDSYFMYHEDLDLGWRLRLAGYKNILAPESVIYHKYEFSKSIKKYYWMERNRFITIFKNYSGRSLVLIFPALLMMEAGALFFSFFSGWWREKLRAYEYFLYPTGLLQDNFSSRNEAISSENCERATKLYLKDKARSPEQFAAEIASCSRKGYFARGLNNWRRIFAERRRIQKLRKVSDRGIAEYFAGKILFQDMDNRALRKIANPLFNLYWIIIRRIM